MELLDDRHSALQRGSWFVRATNCPSFIVRLVAESSAQYIGRGHDCHIRIPDESISRRHARVDFQGSILELIDLGSRNGMLLDGQKMERISVLSGQLVQLGNWELMFTFEECRDNVSTQLAPRSSTKESLFLALTPAQRRVAVLMIEDSTEREIADALSLSYFTIHNHVKEIYRKCGVQSRRQFVSRLQSKEV